MARNQGLILCISYSVGLLLTGLLGIANPHPSWGQWCSLILGLILFYSLAYVLSRHLNYKRFSSSFWLLAGIVALFGAIYLQLRISQPSHTDISRLLQPNTKSQVVVVTGKALTESRRTSNQKIQFWFAPQKVNTSTLNNRTVTGKLYVTLPPLEKTVVRPHQAITIQGVLYSPQPSLNPGSFDFKAYLARQGTFAGLKGLKLIEVQKTPWGLWQIRQRIVDSFRQGLGDSYGKLLGSIVLGRQAVDLPIEVREAFIKGGLAHVLAASGFHVALLLGIVLKLTRSLSSRQQLTIGLLVLIFYVGLTGVQPSIMRATLMGIGALIGMVLDRKIHSLGSLLLAGTILLLLNPLWIWDLGFQLSFLATFGLIVTLPTLQRWLDWLPPTIATLIALPLAASIWTFPLLIYTFSIVLTYSILVNIITAPLIMLISIGGMFSAAIGLIYPVLGSAIAFLLYYPLYLLTAIIVFFNHLPSSSYAVGKIPLIMMIFMYLIMLLIWLNSWFQRYWLVISLFVVTLSILPVVFYRLALVQITVLNSSSEPAIIIQDKGKVTLIDGIEEKTLKYTVIPFLTQQGINKIDYALSLNPSADWSFLSKNISSNKIINLSDIKTREILDLEGAKLELLDRQYSLLQLQFKNQSWLWVRANKKLQNLAEHNLNKNSQVLLWSGQFLDWNWFNIIQPKVAIAATSYLNPKTKSLLIAKQIKYYWTGRDGAIQWTPKQGFHTLSTEASLTD